MRGKTYVGTCGWMYEPWRDWYRDAPRSEWLTVLSSRLDAVEVDGTFYRQQKRETFEKWASAARAGFKFAIRGHRFITHNKKLIDVRDSVLRVKEPALGLGEALVAVLWQLPPQFGINVDRLQRFGDVLAAWPEVRHVMEFRDESWFTDEVLEVMRQRDLTNCISDAPTFPRWDATVGDFVYVRLHGKPDLYASDYGDLLEWVAKVRSWMEQGKTVMVFFDNDALGYAPRDAERLKELLAGSLRGATAVGPSPQPH